MRPLSLALLLAPAAALLPSCRQDHRAMFSQAHQAREDGKFSVALSLLNGILNQIGDDPSPAAQAMRRETILERGQTFRAMAYTEAAIDDFKLVADSLDLDNEYALVSMASSYAERGDYLKGDFDLAIQAADRVLKTAPKDTAALIASGAALYQRGEYALRELKNTVTTLQLSERAAEALTLESAIASGLPENHPRALAALRALENRLDSKSTELRQGTLKNLSSARNDFLLAAGRLATGLGLERPNPLAMVNFLKLLSLTRQDELGVPIVRAALRVREYAVHPGVVEVGARILRDAGLPREAAQILADVIEEKHGSLLSFDARMMLLSCAADAGDARFLSKCIEAIRKRLRKDTVSQILARMLEYFDARLLEMQKGSGDEIDAKLMGFVLRQESATQSLLPDATTRLARRLIQSKKYGDAQRVIEIGVESDANNTDLYLLRADVLLAQGNDALRAGLDIRNALSRRPEQSETLFPKLRDAAERVLQRTSQSLAGVEEEAIAQGKSTPTGLSEGWMFYVFARDFYQRGRYREAAACALESITRDPGLPPVLVTLGLARAKMQEFIPARDALARAADVLPSDPELLREIAESGVAPADLPMNLLEARPQVEGRLAIGESYFKENMQAEAARVLEPLVRDASAPPLARMRAAKLAGSAAPEWLDELAAKLPAGSAAAAQGEQIRLESAMLQNQQAAAEASAARLAKAPRGLVDWVRLARVVDDARAAEHAGAALPAAALIAEATSGTPAGAPSLMLLAHVQAETGRLGEAVESLDRVVSLSSSVDAGVWLALYLHRRGDAEGCKEVLRIVRHDWGSRPLDFKRAAIAALAGTTPTAEELDAVSQASADPLSVLVATTLPAALGIQSGDGVKFPDGPIGTALAHLVGKTKERAQSVLRLALALRTPDGGAEALAELKGFTEPEARALVCYFSGEAKSQRASWARKACADFQAAAAALPELGPAWRRALDAAQFAKDDALADDIAERWAAAAPNNGDATAALTLRRIDQSLRAGRGLAEIEAALAGLHDTYRTNFDVALALLRARLALGVRGAPLMQTVRETLALAGAQTNRLDRACPVVVEAVQASLPASAGEAHTIADALRDAIPTSPGPVELQASAWISEQRPSRAAETVLAALQSPEYANALTADDFARLSKLFVESHPDAAAQIVRLSTAARPSDPRRWAILCERYGAVGRLDEIIDLVAAYVTVDGTASSEAALGDLLTYTSRPQESALEHLDKAGDAAKDARGVLARMRALRKLGRGADAAAAMEAHFGKPPDFGLPASAPASAPAVIDAAHARAAMEGALTLAARGEHVDFLEAVRLLERVGGANDDNLIVDSERVAGLLGHLDKSVRETPYVPESKSGAGDDATKK